MSAIQKVNVTIAAFVITAAAAVAANMYLIHHMDETYTNAIAVFQLNSQFKDRIKRFYLIESDIHKQIRENTPILPRVADHKVFAGEEIEYTIRWYDVLVNSDAYRNLDDSMKTSIGEMKPAIDELAVSFETLRSIRPTDYAARFNYMETVVCRKLAVLNEMCEGIIAQNSITYSIRFSNANAARENRYRWPLLILAVIASGGVMLRFSIVRFIGSADTEKRNAL